VIYPKDIGPILVFADIFAGARVLEAGTGSAALTIALYGAVGPSGRVVSYEVRPEHRERGVANIVEFHGAIPAWVDLREGDLREVAGTGERFDRAVLDLPQPWDMLDTLADVLERRGRSCAATCRPRCRSSRWCWPSSRPGSTTWRRSRRCSAPGT
jgi:tRNA (adenine57-N1/adenine58-N1)-methyltransferase